MFIQADNAAKLWRNATNQILTIPTNEILPCRTGAMFEIPHVLLKLSDPTQKWVTNRKPGMSIAFALAETFWILNGSNDANVINYWNPSLSKFTGQTSTYHGAYGERIRHNQGFDQLERAYLALKNNPNSRQVVIQIWDAKLDMPLEDGAPQDSDIPCNICSFLKIRNNKLEWTQIMRSNDILLGLPYNLIQYTTLQEVLAGWLGLDVGNYYHFSDSLHLYQRDENRIGINEFDNIHNPDKLSIPKEHFDNISNEIFSRMKTMALDNSSEDEIFNMGNLNSNFEAYNNIMKIITAYVARKKGYNKCEQKLLDSCTNDCYKNLWNSWIKR